MAIKFNVIAEVLVDDGVDSSTIEEVINRTLRERGYGTRIKVYQHNMFERLNENADDYILRDAQEEIENEILNSKMCIGGSCED